MSLSSAGRCRIAIVYTGRAYIPGREIGTRTHPITRKPLKPDLRYRRVSLCHRCNVLGTQERELRDLLRPTAPVRPSNPENPGFVLSAAGVIISAGPDLLGSVMRPLIA
jgi:hypothetical protein